MPKIEISHKDLCRLAGKSIPIKALQENDIFYAKGEVDSVDGDTLKIDIKDTNRPDLWSTEGIARELRAKYSTAGLRKYSAGKPGMAVAVDTKSRVQPVVSCAIARGLKMDDHFLSQVIQLQEKIATAFGRSRRELSLGIYDLDKITLPVRYTSRKPQDIRFTPLGFESEMTAQEILSRHPKGREFGHLLLNEKEYPVWVDAKGSIMSMPPIINSRHCGNISRDTKAAFIECTGYDDKFLLTAINILAMQMIDRGASVEAVENIYGGRKTITPDFSTGKIMLDAGLFGRVSGMDMPPDKIALLLKKCGFNAAEKGGLLEVEYPSYRQDIMHQVDIIEDALIAYGYNRIEPRYPRLAAQGSVLGIEKFCAAAAEPMMGMGFQEIMNYTLTNSDELYGRMNIKAQASVEIENYVSANWSVFRTWLLPGLLSFLSVNQHVEFPQKIFEIGDAIIPDGKAETGAQDVRKLACAITDNPATYEHISSALDAFMRSLGLRYRLAGTSHGSFIEGRTASVVFNNRSIGFIGEMNPQVLNNFGIERPAASFEIDLTQLYSARPAKQPAKPLQ
ncbi:MAG: phenylalanine--tRNA ligase subunit beta [Candidatus Aenigmarchaeota archaeon]|nr:phenylalanine--tRNA ligase subunit beta [Candidatus Aenigmarchaeota archaeon]